MNRNPPSKSSSTSSQASAGKGRLVTIGGMEKTDSPESMSPGTSSRYPGQPSRKSSIASVASTTSSTNTNQRPTQQQQQQPPLNPGIARRNTGSLNTNLNTTNITNSQQHQTTSPARRSAGPPISVNTAVKPSLPRHTSSFAAPPEPGAKFQNRTGSFARGGQ